VTPVVLLHSPWVGPRTWAPVAERLRGAGHDVRVQDPRQRCEVRRPLLVPHSGAGLWAPGLAERLDAVGTVFVDAALPGSPGPAPTVPLGLLDHLRGLVGPDGLLPPWTRWWPEDAVAALFPDAATRAEVEAEEPRLPLSYAEGRVEVPAGWETRPCAYLAFGTTYAEETARALGWPVDVLDGAHLHQLVDPDGVAGAVVALAARLA
jgi:hypothetical protein